MPVEELRYIGFSHFEADECGALNNFLEIAPQAEPLCSDIAAIASPDVLTAVGQGQPNTRIFDIPDEHQRKSGRRSIGYTSQDYAWAGRI